MTKFQVKPVRWLTGGGLCLEWSNIFVPMRNYRLSRWVGKRVRQQQGRKDMSAKETQTGINIFCSPSLSRTDPKWEKIETNETGGSKSPEFIHHVASWLTCGWRSVRLGDTAKKKQNQTKRGPLWSEGKVFTGDQFGTRL